MKEKGAKIKIGIRKIWYRWDEKDKIEEVWEKIRRRIKKMGGDDRIRLSLEENKEQQVFH